MPVKKTKTTNGKKTAAVNVAPSPVPEKASAKPAQPAVAAAVKAASSKVASPKTEPAPAAPKKKRTNGNGVHASTNGTVEVVKTNGTNETVVTELPQIQIDQTAIARRAWEIWQSEGCPDGREVEHWLRAEKELSATLSF